MSALLDEIKKAAANKKAVGVVVEKEKRPQLCEDEGQLHFLSLPYDHDLTCIPYYLYT
jgi:hypothetical protein